MVLYDNLILQALYVKGNSQVLVFNYVLKYVKMLKHVQHINTEIRIYLKKFFFSILNVFSPVIKGLIYNCS